MSERETPLTRTNSRYAKPEFRCCCQPWTRKVSQGMVVDVVESRIKRPGQANGDDGDEDRGTGPGTASRASATSGSDRGPGCNTLMVSPPPSLDTVHPARLIYSSRQTLDSAITSRDHEPTYLRVLDNDDNECPHLPTLTHGRGNDLRVRFVYLLIICLT
jgi:hypothetical protein